MDRVENRKLEKRDILEIKAASKQLKGTSILNDITMKMESGKIYGLRGVNGSGKTMLLRLMCGLIYADKGEVLWNAKCLGREIDFPESVGIFLEKPSFLERYTGKKNLELLADLKEGCSKDDVDRILLEVGLSGQAEKKYRKYSLGMKQRLGIGAALLGSPRLLLLDEPMNAIDEKGVSYFKEIFLREKERGALVVIASHDASFLNCVCDKIFLLGEGRIAREE
ncbi:MAG: ATP-binding cassette domain-containing protein [Lachnospiraceae bacterium]|nr:ATP-binding cassette domain-containing protein [Lachnospiraceae bacterium]